MQKKNRNFQNFKLVVPLKALTILSTRLANTSKSDLTRVQNRLTIYRQDQR